MANYYTQKEITRRGYGLENNMIEKVDVKIIAHFGNIPCFTIVCENIIPYGCYNDVARLGHLMQWFVEFFECDREDGRWLSDIKNIPCRLIFEKNGDSHWGEKAIGIGHYMKDKFILFDELDKVLGGAK